VGDAVISSWPLRDALHNAAIVRCLFAVERRAKVERPMYLREFGVAPVLRAVLHAGPIAVGEVGDSRREITFLGDTLNTAARLEQVCGELGHRAVISQQLLARLTLPEGVRAEALGPIPLAGKVQPVSLYALTAAVDPRVEDGSN
jgi:adenylate cyclase